MKNKILFLCLIVSLSLSAVKNNDVEADKKTRDRKKVHCVGGRGSWFTNRAIPSRTPVSGSENVRAWQDLLRLKREQAERVQQRQQEEERKQAEGFHNIMEILKDLNEGNDVNGGAYSFLTFIAGGPLSAEGTESYKKELRWLQRQEGGSKGSRISAALGK